ncbi:DUF3122 domain-containing protein [Nodosilinea sp. LEGE 07298]|uniref:DUF3122 domain-containing protein n=1 Tax=Nodosilinea sp. LEGE 07298 TaxID=2777970 RepID=UPI0018830AA2|nr:DUF3122 domain-containing protein [Nodosilinea sp. LEGE 07298]MBE9108494.1 DUF3122 domain-containing protein [Nodosilinea sp. LEGE 07298]
MPYLWRALRLTILALLLGCLLLLALAEPAMASVHTYHEQPGQTTHRSRQSLRDQNDVAWQATVFKRYQEGHLEGVYLRLVGFPGQGLVDRQSDLLVQTGTATQWAAAPLLDSQTQDLPENVAQYDVDTILSHIQRPGPLTLVVPLATGTVVRLVVAPYVVEEWLHVYSLEDDPEVAA